MAAFKWCAVVVALEKPREINGVKLFKNPGTDNYIRSDFEFNGVPHAVVFKCGHAIENLARSRAELYKGKLLIVEGETPFDPQDVLRTLEELNHEKSI